MWSPISFECSELVKTRGGGGCTNMVIIETQCRMGGMKHPVLEKPSLEQSERLCHQLLYTVALKGQIRPT